MSAKRIQTKHMFFHRLFKLLVVSSVLSMCLYVYSLSSVIYGVVERRALEKEVMTLSSDISVMEAEYLAQTSTLTRSVALSEGFINPNKLSYEDSVRVAFNDAKNSKNGN